MGYPAVRIGPRWVMVLTNVADEFIRSDTRHIVGIGLGTSQFVPQAAGPALWEWSHITSEDRDSVEVPTVGRHLRYWSSPRRVAQAVRDQHLCWRCLRRGLPTGCCRVGLSGRPRRWAC
jgi:hypothetical protein